MTHTFHRRARRQLKARLHHPMVLGVKVWAFSHLLVGRTLAAEVLFAAFLLWAVLSFRVAWGHAWLIGVRPFG